MVFRSILIAAALLLTSTSQTNADQWGSSVFAHCYQLKGFFYQRHFFVRVFYTELGGGQLHTGMDGPDNEPRSLWHLSTNPVTCDIEGKEFRFETVGYRPPTMRGYCGSCDQTGFRLTVEGKTIWHVDAPKTRGDPIFNGTIDADEDAIRICTENRPEDIGVTLPHENGDASSRTSVLVCKTYGY